MTLPFHLQIWKKKGLDFLFTINEDFPVRAHILVTYWELSQDLKVGSQSLRLSLAKKIIRALKLPVQCFKFFPITKFQDGRFKLVPDSFLQSIKQCAPIAIICFGKKSMQIFNGRTISEYGCFYINGCHIFFLPALDDMLPDNRPLKQLAWNVIKDIKKIPVNKN